MQTLMITQNDFFTKYNIDPKLYAATGLNWDDLIRIHSDYSMYINQLEPSATLVFNLLMKCKGVHSVRYRLKNPEHLIEKIIRKKIKVPDVNITIDNYKSEVKDLIGLRALHLFKDDWERINDYIKEIWMLNEPPTANYRKGDSEELIDFFREKGCEVKEHEYGYRSVHYVIEMQPVKEKHLAEIQVRTIFEEAWSEIDHTIRYPYEMENPIFSQFLLILNRLSGGADEMGTFIKYLQKDLREKNDLFQKQLDDKNTIISDLERKIDKANVRKEELQEMRRDLEKLRNPFSTHFATQFNQTQNLQKAMATINSSFNAMSLLTPKIQMPKFDFLQNFVSVDQKTQNSSGTFTNDIREKAALPNAPKVQHENKTVDSQVNTTASKRSTKSLKNKPFKSKKNTK